MCGGGGKQRYPDITPMVSPPTREEAAGTSEAEKERARLRKIAAGGRGSTILTSYAGVGSSPDVEQKTVLGA